MLFDGWQPILHVLVLGPLGYLALILLLRASGKRTLSKMNAFDFVVTVALGSTLATLLLSQQTALATGVVAFAVLIGLQFVITFISVRSRRFARFVKAEPTLLYHGGRFLTSALRRTRVTESEVQASIREQGIASMQEVSAVVLETDSSVSVLPKASRQPSSTLSSVQNYQTEGDGLPTGH